MHCPRHCKNTIPILLIAQTSYPAIGDTKVTDRICARVHSLVWNVHKFRIVAQIMVCYFNSSQSILKQFRGRDATYSGPAAARVRFGTNRNKRPHYCGSGIVGVPAAGAKTQRNRNVDAGDGKCHCTVCQLYGGHVCETTERSIEGLTVDCLAGEVDLTDSSCKI